MTYHTYQATQYSPRYLLGRLANGHEGGKGRLWHALPASSGWTAVCGAKPGSRSGGWGPEDPSNISPEQEVTCAKCLKKIESGLVKTPPYKLNRFESRYCMRCEQLVHFVDVIGNLAQECMCRQVILESRDQVPDFWRNCDVDVTILW